MKVVGYIRVSTEEQAKDGVSLDNQRAKIQAYCEFKDMELVEVIADEGISGSKSNRNGFQRVISLCEKKQVEAVIVYSISRFTRSTKDLLNFIDTYVIKKNINLHSLTESLDTSTATGRFMLKIMGAMNELEREQIGERTKSVLEFKKSKSEKTGGDIPYGYDLAEDGKKLIENETEQKTIRYILQLKEKGYTDNGIATKLNNEGYQTKNGRKWFNVQINRIINRRAG